MYTNPLGLVTGQKAFSRSRVGPENLHSNRLQVIWLLPAAKAYCSVYVSQTYRLPFSPPKYFYLSYIWGPVVDCEVTGVTNSRPQLLTLFLPEPAGPSVHTAE